MSQIDHVRSFLAAYRAGSLSRAAEDLGITQPAISIHIKSLENALGKPLFVRVSRGVMPTPAAHAFALEIATPLDHLEQALGRARARSAVLSGTVHIAGPAEFLTEWLAERLTGVATTGLSLRFHVGNRDLIRLLLEEGTADLAVTASALEGRHLRFAELHRERLLLVASPGFGRQISGRNIGAELLSGLSAIAYDEDRPLIRQFGQHVFRADITPKLVAIAPDLRLVRRFVEEGHGWSVLPDYLCAEAIARGRLIQLGKPDCGPQNPLYLVWPKANLRHARVSLARNTILDAVSHHDRPTS